MSVVTQHHGALEPVIQDRLRKVGYGSETEHAGTIVIVDQDVSRVLEPNPDVEVLPLADALLRHDWVQDLFFGLIDPDANDDIRRVAARSEPPVGYFVHVRPGAKVSLPVQLFTLLGVPQARQYLHSVIVVEEDAELDIVSGSTVRPGVRAGRHVSVSETYLRRGATCRSVSVEQWGDDMEVVDYASSLIGPGATDISTSVMLSNVKSYRAENRVRIEEDGSSRDQSIVYSPEGTDRVLESSYLLAGDGARAESIARMVSAGGTITNRSTLVGDGENSAGYLGCDGLKLTAEGQIHSAPALVANAASAQLSHEASIGVIGSDKINYLRASGLSEDDARKLLIQGFLDLDDALIPRGIRQEVTDIIAAAKSGAL